MTEEKMTIEERLDAISSITEQLESGKMTLEESLQAFEEGVKLIREAQDALKDAEKRLAVLTEEKSE